MSRFVLLIFAIKSRSRRKTEQMLKFVAPILAGATTPTLLRQNRDLPSTVWQSLVEFRLLISVCEAWQWSRKENLRRVGEYSLPIWSRLCTKVHVVLKRCRRPLVVCTHLPDYVCHVSFRRYRLSNLPLSCEFVEKRWFLDPRFVGEEDTPDFGHAFSNCTYFRACGRLSLSSVQRVWRAVDEKRKKERRIPV